MAKSIRKRTNDIPVFVVEDHQDVVPHIHRLVGAKRIHYKGLSLVHFDAHSDLSVPREIDAESVYDVQTLYQEMSIENWIIPLVYAGHVDVVVWIKPPWTQDSMSINSQFQVGRDEKSKKLCVSSTDNYFLSELAHLLPLRMDNTNLLCLLVQTLPEKESVDVSQNIKRSCSDDGSNKRIHLENSGQEISPANCSDKLANQAEINNLGKSNILVDCDIPSIEIINNKRDLSLKSASKKSVNETSGVFEGTQVECNKDYSSTKCDGIRQSASRVNGNVPSDYVSDLATKARQLIYNHYQLPRDCERQFILDIDLDFFSTQDPFNKQLSSEQYNLLKELYKFTPPKENALYQDIKDCISSRKRQIKELKKALSFAQKGEIFHLNDSVRDKLFQDLLACSAIEAESIAGSSKDADSNSIDYVWLHEIGTGIDDNLLPDHVSTNTEIVDLVAAVKSYLQNLPCPVAITIARSSNDDYCPKHQVDMIQMLVLDMLQSIYSTLDIKLTYK